MDIIDPCLESINVPSDYSVDYRVNTDAMTIDYTTGYSVGSTPEISALCGPISYFIASGLKSEAISLSPTAEQLIVYSSIEENMIGQSIPVVI